MSVIRLDTVSAEQTERVGAVLADGLRAGDVVLVHGELGSGKTTLVRGACRRLGVTGNVASPTYVIGQSYAAPTPVSHIDLYRLDSLAGEDPALLADYITSESISFVEWPERAGDSGLPDPEAVAARVQIDHRAESERAIEISGEDRVIDALAQLTGAS